MIREDEVELEAESVMPTDEANSVVRTGEADSVVPTNEADKLHASSYLSIASCSNKFEDGCEEAAASGSHKVPS